jgi:hypothetical protein
MVKRMVSAEQIAELDQHSAALHAGKLAQAFDHEEALTL